MFAEIPFHWLDPIIIHVYGPIAIRWYGLTFILGFLAGLMILKRLSRSGFLPLNIEQVMDFLVWLVIGVILGGRIGYSLFYNPEMWSNPIQLIKVWEGGLSFHGGLLGVAIATIIYIRRKGVAFLPVADSLALAVTPGIFSVRAANFINGELFGRVTDASVPWAMRFPADPVVKPLLHKLGHGFTNSPQGNELVLRKAYEQGDWGQIMQQVPLRHPSQVYEALLEGLALGIILWLVYRTARRRAWRVAPGAYISLFLGGYGVMRFIVEFFREPDAQFKGKLLLGTFSRGQELCFAMILAAAILFFWSRKRQRA